MNNRTRALLICVHVRVLTATSLFTVYHLYLQCKQSEVTEIARIIIIISWHNLCYNYYYYDYSYLI